MEYNEVQYREDSAEKMELCLCSRCASDFYNMDNYRIKRVDMLQTEKDTCTFCSYRRGYDFYVWPVSNARKPQRKDSCTEKKGAGNA